MNSSPALRQGTADEAVRQAGSIFYASHNWHPFFLQGTKLIAYEIWEDLGFRAPENVIVPAGAGSLVLGCWIGFSELLRAGQIDRLPRILAVQPENCSRSPLHLPNTPPRPSTANGNQASPKEPPLPILSAEKKFSQQ